MGRTKTLPMADWVTTMDRATKSTAYLLIQIPQYF
jgi:hypothetical protein